ncbi:MAG: redoxin domain-containing protein [Planctomycetes bacterium]|nr:redoxin domain-containing protein [Planctomycetota bacterium]
MNRADDILLARLAEQAHYLTPSQLDRLLQELAQGTPRGMPDLLLERGLVTREQLDDLLRRQAATLGRPTPSPAASPKDSLLGAEAVRRGWMTAESLSSALQLQARRSAQGTPTRLGEVLVELGLLAPGQVQRILATQGKRLFACAPCSKQFNVAGAAEGASVRCPKCQSPMTPVTEARRVDAAGTAFFPALGSHPPAPPANEPGAASAPARLPTPARPVPADDPMAGLHTAPLPDLGNNPSSAPARTPLRSGEATGTRGRHDRVGSAAVAPPGIPWAVVGGLACAVALGIGGIGWWRARSQEEAARVAAHALAREYARLEQDAAGPTPDLAAFGAACAAFVARAGASPLAEQARQLPAQARRAEARRHIAGLEAALGPLLGERKFAAADALLAGFPPDLDPEGELFPERDRLAALLLREEDQAFAVESAAALGLADAGKFDEATARVEETRAWEVARLDPAREQALAEIAQRKALAEAQAGVAANAADACERILADVDALAAAGRWEEAIARCDRVPPEAAGTAAGQRVQARKLALQAELRARTAPAAVPVLPPPGVTPVAGQLAPEFKTKDFMGRSFGLGEHRGKVVLLTFWSTASANFAQEAAGFARAAGALRNEGLVLLGVSLDTDREALLRFVMKNGMNWPQYFDALGPAHEVAALYGIHEVPVHLLVDAAGVVRRVERSGLEALGGVRGLLAAAGPPEEAAGRGGAGAPTVAAASKLVKCRTCLGTGVREKPCAACDEAGGIACPVCPDPGFPVCSNCVGTGILRRGGTGSMTRRCLVCNVTGRITCPWCKGTRRAQDPVCDGTRKITDTCSACQGMGFRLEGAPVPVALCAVCSGRRAVTCPRCAGSRSVTVSCPTCLRGSIPCKTCRGKWRVVCLGCRGDGKTDIMSSTRTAYASLICRGCDGVGFKPCPDCKNAESTCAACYGTSRITQPCPQCAGTAEVPCIVCRP